MNRHFYGFPKGLPLDSLAKPTFASSWNSAPYGNVALLGGSSAMNYFFLYHVRARRKR